METEPKRWVIRGEGEFAVPVLVPEEEVIPEEPTLVEERDLKPLTGTTVIMDHGQSTQVES